MNENGEIRLFATTVRSVALDLVDQCDHIITNQSDDNVKPDRVSTSRDSGPFLEQIAQMIYKARRARDLIAPEKDLFHDPAWDIMLDLYIARCQHKAMSVTSASMAAGVPLSTALRWVWHLERLLLVTRQIDPRDRRRSFVSLTAAGLRVIEDALTDYFDRASVLFKHLRTT